MSNEPCKVLQFFNIKCSKVVWHCIKVSEIGTMKVTGRNTKLECEENMGIVSVGCEPTGFPQNGSHCYEVNGCFHTSSLREPPTTNHTVHSVWGKKWDMQNLLSLHHPQQQFPTLIFNIKQLFQMFLSSILLSVMDP